MLRAVYFDLDDTLADAAPAWQSSLAAAFARLRQRHPHLSEATVRAAWQAVLAELIPPLEGGQLTMAQVRDARFARLLAALGVPDPAFARTLDLCLGERFLADVRLVPGADAVLTALRPRYHLGIITNGADDAHPDSQRTKAAHLGLLERVASFLASDTAGARKPDPRIFRLALARDGIPPSAAVYVGDAIANDVVGANRAGMLSVLLWRAPQPPPPLAGEERPRATLTALADLPALLARLDEHGALDAPPTAGA